MARFGAVHSNEKSQGITCGWVLCRGWCCGRLERGGLAGAPTWRKLGPPRIVSAIIMTPPHPSQPEAAGEEEVVGGGRRYPG